MITGNTKLNEFNNFFVSNYKYLLNFTKSIDVKNDYESLLHDCYLKCHNRIDVSGYSGNTYLNFMRVTIMNTYKTNYRDKKDVVSIDSPDVDFKVVYGGVRHDFKDLVEQKLLEEEQYQQQRKDYDNEMAFVNTMIFEYVDKYFDAKTNMVFKTYYVLKHKHLNYQQLALATNYSVTSVSNIIKNVKKDLKVNLMCYINTGYRIMELKQLVDKVEAILKTDVRQNKQNYLEAYRQCFNKQWIGCNCNLTTLRESLKAWYVKNKEILNTQV